MTFVLSFTLKFSPVEAYPVGAPTEAYAAAGMDFVREGVERRARVNGCRSDCMVEEARGDLF